MAPKNQLLAPADTPKHKTPTQRTDRTPAAFSHMPALPQLGTMLCCESQEATTATNCHSDIQQSNKNDSRVGIDCQPVAVLTVQVQ